MVAVTRVGRSSWALTAGGWADSHSPGFALALALLGHRFAGSDWLGEFGGNGGDLGGDEKRRSDATRQRANRFAVLSCSRRDWLLPINTAAGTTLSINGLECAL